DRAASAGLRHHPLPQRRALHRGDDRVGAGADVPVRRARSGGRRVARRKLGDRRRLRGALPRPRPRDPPGREPRRLPRAQPGRGGGARRVPDVPGRRRRDLARHADGAGGRGAPGSARRRVLPMAPPAQPQRPVGARPRRCPAPRAGPRRGAARVDRGHRVGAPVRRAVDARSVRADGRVGRVAHPERRRRPDDAGAGAGGPPRGCHRRRGVLPLARRVARVGEPDLSPGAQAALAGARAGQAGGDPGVAAPHGAVRAVAGARLPAGGAARLPERAPRDGARLPAPRGGAGEPPRRLPHPRGTAGGAHPGAGAQGDAGADAGADGHHEPTAPPPAADAAHPGRRVPAM
ncbi:MAG: hypothetical protein AVDCRST_MAG68-4725, partial [uncultured Gemmatimonadetes bacterium]